jgi:phospho-N-acetylmuramoyl-pentapeptide-transferase
MLYWLADLSSTLSFFNVFRYLTVRTGGAMFTSGLFVFLLGPWIIDHLRLKQGKAIGGLIILGVVVATLLWANPRNPYVWAVMAVMLGFGAVGFYNDHLKVTRQATTDFGGVLRLSIEALIAIAACAALASLGRPQMVTSLSFPLFKEMVVNFDWFFILVGAFIIIGAGNAVNLADGLGVLTISAVMIVAATFGAIAYLIGNAVFADYLQVHYVPGTGELAIVCGAVVGAGLGLLFNAPRASIFVGGTASLALGGLVGAVAVTASLASRGVI